MKVLAGFVLAGVILGSRLDCAQTVTATPAAQTPVAAAAKEPGAGADNRTERQRAFAAQTERLSDMATELKAEVDKTNRNILSLTVVRKAEEIEALARKMKEQARK